jgi:hypothetical protein
MQLVDLLVIGNGWNAMRNSSGPFFRYGTVLRWTQPEAKRSLQPLSIWPMRQLRW